MKVVCMIPARAESSRIKQKGLRYLGNKPLVKHVIDVCKKVDLFDDIYLNSPNEIFRNIAEECSISFYKRRKWKKKQPETNDEFMYNFLKDINCDFVVQVNPTSPFITADTISNFCRFIVNDDVDTCITVKDIQIEALYEDNPINFDANKKMPRSQDLNPINIYSSSMFGFKRETFIKTYEKHKYALSGPIGLTKYFKINDIEGFDIDYEEDFQIAEAMYESLRYKREARYYNPNEVDEADVPLIMDRDGVKKFGELEENINNINTIINNNLRDKSWSERIINTENNSATLIYQLPSEGNRLHYHHDWNEWWYIIEGDWEFIVGDDVRMLKKYDVILIPRNTWHKITVIGDKPGIRLAVARDDMVHTYKK